MEKHKKIPFNYDGYLKGCKVSTYEDIKVLELHLFNKAQENRKIVALLEDKYSGKINQFSYDVEGRNDNLPHSHHLCLEIRDDCCFEPFSISKALNGSKLITRKGDEVFSFHFSRNYHSYHCHDKNCNCCTVEIFNAIYQVDIFGKYSFLESEFDIFMK